MLEVNLFASAYRLFHEDFSPIYKATDTLKYRKDYGHTWHQMSLLGLGVIKQLKVFSRYRMRYVV